jgi:hypothetical protein
VLHEPHVGVIRLLTGGRPRLRQGLRPGESRHRE